LVESIDVALTDELEDLIEKCLAAARYARLQHESAGDERQHDNAGERDLTRTVDP
jgi:hypothetical protein